MKHPVHDIPSGPQGGMVYNPDPYKSFPCPYRLRDLTKYIQETGRSWEELSEEERKRFRVPGK
jgi:hypothetical protein